TGCSTGESTPVQKSDRARAKSAPQPPRTISGTAINAARAIALARLSKSCGMKSPAVLLLRLYLIRPKVRKDSYFSPPLAQAQTSADRLSRELCLKDRLHLGDLERGDRRKGA